MRNLGIQAEIIGSNSVSALAFDDPHSAENTLSALHAAPHVMFAEIYTPDGHAFAGYLLGLDRRLDRGFARDGRQRTTIAHGRRHHSWRRCRYRHHHCLGAEGSECSE